jgi:DNA-binding LytR/AlgR family response regulator
MKCVIVDDEPLAIGILEDYVAKVPFLECAGTFGNAIEALAAIQRGGIDLVFLDVNMPELTGFQLLRALTHPPRVILTTAYSEYALTGYDYDVVDYLLKPIEFERFLKAVTKARDLERHAGGLDTRDRTILVKSGTRLHHLRVADIRSAHAAGNYVAFRTAEREILSLMTMKEAVELLAGLGFARVHRSHIVNLQHVELIEEDEVVVDKRRLPIAEAYRDGLIRALQDHRQ